MPGQPRWSIAHALSPDQVADVRATRSRGIIAEALATGETVCTKSALDDPRFNARESVCRARLDAALCAPIGSDPPRGVLYLAGRMSAGSFALHHRECVELVARHLAPVVDRLLLQERLDDGDDPTRALRAQLKLDNVIGRSEAMAAVFREVAIAGRSAKTVLLTGQSGTGKTQIACVIHENSPRAKHRFVEISCKTLTETLVENLLFGYTKGAFTGADRDRSGLVAAAEHGTLFLDDIDSLCLSGQAALLQLLQCKRYYPLGQTTPVQADIRVIAGSHVDLQAAVEKGQFRQYLLFRLDVVTIRLPPLEERGRDIRHLAEGLCAGRGALRGSRRASCHETPCARSRPRSGRATCASSSTESRSPWSARGTRAPCRSSAGTFSRARRLARRRRIEPRPTRRPCRSARPG